MTPEEALLALRAVATLRTALLGLALYAFARLTVYVWRPLLDRVFVSTSVVRFVPYDASAMGSATVCVDCTHRNLPTLTHHKDGSTPKHLRGDTSTDTVFNALRAGWRPLKIANAVTCNHFDIDGLISAWALIEPLKALEHEDVLRETARIGDFRELRVTRGRGDGGAKGAECAEGANDGNAFGMWSETTAALRLCAWINSVERTLFTRPFEGNEHRESARKYAHFLPLVVDALNAVEPGAGSTAEADDAAAERSGLHSGDEEVARVLDGVTRLYGTGFDEGEPPVRETWDDLGVCVVRGESPVHYYALFSLATDADVVVAVYSGGRYEVECRYTGFVDYRSRATWPRFNLRALASTLNTRDAAVTSRGSHLRWDVSGYTDPGPVLRLDDTRPGEKLSRAERYGSPDERRIHVSALTPEAFLLTVRAFFEHAARGARTHLGVSDNSKIAKRDWSWRETHELNAKIDWAGFNEGV